MKGVGPDYQEWLAAIVQSSDDAIFSKDLDGMVTSWNSAAEELYGYSAAEMIGSHITTIIPSEQRGEEILVLDRITAGQRIDHYETIRKTKDGRLVEISLTASPIHDEEGNVVGASVIARDISDRKRYEAIQRDLDILGFMGKIVHEFRTPLTAISGMADLLSQHDDLSSEQRHTAIESIQRQSRRAQGLMNDLLDLVRIRTPEFSVDLRPVRLSTAVKDAVTNSHPEGDVMVDIDVPSNIEVSADPVRLEQVLVNLLVNAYRYGGPEVLVSADTEGDLVRVLVADNGPGVKDELIPVLFDPFTRGSSDSTGSGLGLAIVKRLVDAFGGDVEYEGSERDGARFTITLVRAT